MGGRGTRVLEELEGQKLVAAAVNAHTRMSDGALAAYELVAFVHLKVLGVYCVTDRHFNDWRYAWASRSANP
jgi:hypothetical protein